MDGASDRPRTANNKKVVGRYVAMGKRRDESKKRPRIRPKRLNHTGSKAKKTVEEVGKARVRSEGRRESDESIAGTQVALSFSGLGWMG